MKSRAHKLSGSVSEEKSLLFLYVADRWLHCDDSDKQWMLVRMEAIIGMTHQHEDQQVQHEWQEQKQRIRGHRDVGWCVQSDQDNDDGRKHGKELSDVQSDRHRVYRTHRPSGHIYQLSDHRTCHERRVYCIRKHRELCHLQSVNQLISWGSGKNIMKK